MNIGWAVDNIKIQNNLVPGTCLVQIAYAIIEAV